MSAQVISHQSDENGKCCKAIPESNKPLLQHAVKCIHCFVNKVTRVTPARQVERIGLTIWTVLGHQQEPEILLTHTHTHKLPPVTYSAAINGKCPNWNYQTPLRIIPCVAELEGRRSLGKSKKFQGCLFFVCVPHHSRRAKAAFCSETPYRLDRSYSSFPLPSTGTSPFPFSGCPWTPGEHSRSWWNSPPTCLSELT